MTKQAKEKHGMKGTRIYRTWQNIKNRCSNKNVPCYGRYGGKGITVCDEWQNSFIAFYEWAMANGYEDHLTIDRIDSTGNYEPSNCRWITNTEQQNNKKNNVMVTYKGETKTLPQWARTLGMNYMTLYSRIVERGWTVERAFEQKVGERCG